MMQFKENEMHHMFDGLLLPISWDTLAGPLRHQYMKVCVQYYKVL